MKTPLRFGSVPTLLVLAFVASRCDCNSKSGLGDGGGGSPDAGTFSDSGTSPDAGPADAGVSAGASVLEYHNNPSHDGHYIVPGLTHDAGAGLHRDTTFDGTVDNTASMKAQPLYWDNSGSGADLVIAATESNQVTALRATDGQPQWQTTVANPVPLAQLGCGNFDPVGITGTPVIDPASRTVYFDAMTPGPTHQLWALSLDDGGTRTGYPISMDTVLASMNFSSHTQSQRGALTLRGSTVYVPFGGFYGDCLPYRGVVAGFPESNPAGMTFFSTAAMGGGIWSPGGVFSDNASVYAATGNTFSATTGQDGEAVVRFAIGSQLSSGPADIFFPTSWKALDNSDLDLGGATPALFDLPGNTPAHYLVALGKDGNAYLLNRDDLGSRGTDGGGQVDQLHISSGEILGTSAAFTTPTATYVVTRVNGSGVGCPTGQSGDLVALRIGTGTPALSVAWCRSSNGGGSPIVTTTDELGSNAIVWIAGAEGDNKLHGFDGDTGAVIFAGGGAPETMGTVAHFNTPMVAKGRIFVGGDGKVYAFTP